MGLLGTVVLECLAGLAAHRTPGELVKIQVPGPTSAQLDLKF